MAEYRDEYNRGGMIAFVFSMAFVLCFFGYLVFVHPGADLNEKVKDPHAPVAQAAAAAVDVATIAEPWVANEAMVEHGKKVFSTNCAMCHGNEGKGDGPAGAALNPKPKNLVEGPWKQGGDSISLFKTLATGIAGSSMPGFSQISSVDRWALVQFIRSITKAKVDDKAYALKAFGASAK
jgi:mono/diheme cytochrome c family protein